MKMLSSRIANMLFGKHDRLYGELRVLETLSHPNGSQMMWSGNDGLLFMLFWKIEALERRVSKLESRSK